MRKMIAFTTLLVATAFAAVISAPQHDSTALGGNVASVTEAQVNAYLSQIANKQTQYNKFLQVLPGGSFDGVDLPPNVRIDTYGDNQYIVVVSYVDKEVEYFFDTQGLVKTATYTYLNASST